MPSLSPRLWLFLTLTCLLVIAFHEWRLLPNGRVHATLLDLPHDQAVFIAMPTGTQMLIEEGADQSLLEALGEQTRLLGSSLDLLVIPSLRAPDIAIASELLGRMTIRTMLIPPLPRDSSADRLRQAISATATKTIVADQSRTFDDGHGCTIESFPSPALASSPPSMIVRFLCGDSSIVIPGILRKEEMEALLRSGMDVHGSTLLLPQQGLPVATSSGFLLAVHPHLAISTLAVAKPLQDRLAHFGISLRIMAKGGEIVIGND
ncbi:hypothetical protein HY285_02100 [Candidatus Peregrinibacteria bacterium]|nr:hypothetical protein [Candidatus Peregrinibacteria bacterium]MBI3816318.1 hypothetical protein [Candidatus Peregrinibacteria bacterium]